LKAENPDDFLLAAK